MVLDDLDDPVEAPSRTSRFAPKSSKLPPRPKPEPLPKLVTQDLGAPISKKVEDEEEDSKPSLSTVPKAEPSDFNDAVKMEVDAKSEPEEASKEEDAMDVDGDEDEIIREIDVYFNPSLDPNTHLYVLQYPLRSHWRPYGLDERCEEVRVKPATGEIEVDLSIDVDSRNYDNDCASSLKITKQTLSCVWKTPRQQATSPAVGVLMGNKLHVNPIHAVLQLRPSMGHFKSGGVPKKQNKQTESSTELKADEEECCIQLNYHGSTSDLSTRYLQRMVAKESSPIQFTMNPYNYVSSFCPGSSNKIRPKGLSRRHLLSMALEERIKKLLCEGAQVHRFSVLKHFAPDDSVEDVLGVLQQHALLVQGLWVPKSSLLFTDSGLQPLARDYTLLLFSKNSMISFTQLDVPPTLSKAMKGFLKILAVERPSFKDWKFREHTDVSFIKCYPNIVHNQEQVWKSIENRLVSVIHKGGKSGSGLKNSITKPSMVSKPEQSTKPSMAIKSEQSLNPDKGAPKGSSGVLTGTMSDETRESLPKALLKLFQNYRVCSLPLIRQGLRELAVSQTKLPRADKNFIAAALGVEAPEDELKEVISQVAININEVYVLKSFPEHPEYDPLRNVVIGLLRGNGHNAKLKKGDIFAAAEHALKRKITNNEYVKVMNDLCQFKGSAWVMKSGDGNQK